ncbi:protein kintoun [Orussus abietinus]|uniref:protein kintoun n=1 Tax=Orussus abietinus TaxID=222816 RepID=UPI000625F531|nr:protein kintoun [Orussus abietinus]
MDSFGAERRNDWEDLDVTREEINKLTECLKKEEFRKLLIEYAEEVTDPENRKIFEEEITRLERKRGVDVTFVNPQPGYVIKTSVDGTRKCFINISKSETVGKPESKPSFEEGRRGLGWSLPFTLAPPRDDLDKRKVRCTVFDVVFHPDTLYLASRDPQFKELVNDTALDSIEKNFKVKLDRKNIKFPKMGFKGISQPTVIRKPMDAPVDEYLDMEPEIYQKLMSSYDQHRERHHQEEKPKRSPPKSVYSSHDKSEDENLESKYAMPKFIVKHRTDVELDEFRNCMDAKMHAAIPKTLVVIVDLPLLKSANDASLDVQERLLSLKSESPAKYRLELPLPYRVDADKGNAKFDPKYKKLTVTLPVIREIVSMISGEEVPSIIKNTEDKDLEDVTREDSGVSSDDRSPVQDSLDDKLASSTFNSFANSEKRVTKENSAKLITVINETCNDMAPRTNGNTVEPRSIFMNPNLKYSLPMFTCNSYNNFLAVTVNVKNVDPDSIRHRILENCSGLHILLTSVGAGFFPVYYSLCLKLGESLVEPDSLKTDPWDNNVVFTVTLTSTEGLSGYFVGLDEQFMEAKDLPTPMSLTRRFNELLVEPKEDTNHRIKVSNKGSDMVIDIHRDHLDSDDEADQVDLKMPTRKHERKRISAQQMSRSISESSGDELPSVGSSGRAKGILKSRRSCQFSRSVSESSIDDGGAQAFSTDPTYDSIDEINSQSDSSSLKKTVRFNDVVSRQLYRSNSSILGQRKKNQRKLRNKKRAHDRRLSESENSETDERDKYRIIPGDSSGKENPDVVRSILSREKSQERKQTAVIQIEGAPKDPSASGSRNRDVDFKENDASPEVLLEGIVKAEFKNDLIFDLDI